MFSINRIFLVLLCAPLLAMMLARAALADPPARVARINYLDGPVSLMRGDLNEWDRAVINYPLVTGDSLWTDEQARAELHVGSTALRLADQTSIAFLNLNDRVVQIRLAQGTAELYLTRLDVDETYEIDTPDGTVSLLRAGDYRIEVDEAGNSTFITRHGQAEVTTGNAAFAVTAGQQAYVANSAELTYNISSAIPFDDFDRWANERARREEQSVSARYVSREMIGYEDLDAYGSWTVLADYGNVWTPLSVPVGWSPYSTGQWVWGEPYGWTWVDVEPWGFAPFHYGRWAFVSSTWYWVPGPIVARPVFAPALVGFVGGNGWGMSLGFGGGIGWFPLGPGEIYQPAYLVSDRYLRGINPAIVTNTYITTNYVNRIVPGAVTVVSPSAFTSGRIVTTSRINLAPRVLAEAPLIGATAPIAPQRASLLARTERNEIVSRPPDSLRERAVMTKLAPAPAAIPFAAKQSALASSPGRPIDASSLERIRREAPTRQAQETPTRPVNPQFSHQAAPPERATPGINRPPLAGGIDRRERMERPEAPPQAPLDRAPETRFRSEQRSGPNSSPVVRPELPQVRQPQMSRPSSNHDARHVGR